MEWPDRLESGNLNVPGIFGLEAGVSEVLRRGVDSIAQEHHQQLLYLENKLAAIGQLVRHGPTATDDRVGIASFTIPQVSPQELSALLDSVARIQVRSGIHCAPRMHAALGTAPQGTVRISLGHTTTLHEIDQATAVLAEIAADF